MKRLLVSCLLMASLAVQAREPFALPLYPDGVPQSNGLEGKERPRESGDGFIYDVSVPTMTVYLPDAPTGRVVVICPGGGYAGVSMRNEGYWVSEWLNARGIAAVVLKYRMPNGQWTIPLDDVHTAVRTTRANAEKWGLDPAKLGVMGFSAGGHLASCAAVFFDERTRPDFSVLIYPVITMDESTHSGSRTRLLGEGLAATDKALYDSLAVRYSTFRQVSASTPVTFIALSDDDRTVQPVNSTLYYNALKAAKVPAEMHIYPAGGHGWGWKPTFPYRDEFLTSFGRWLDALP